jgi:hypothetical protein
MLGSTTLVLSDSEDGDEFLGISPIGQPLDASSSGRTSRMYHIWIPLHHNLSLAACEQLPEVKCHRFAHGVNNGGSHSKVMKCAAHSNCEHYLRMKQGSGGGDVYDIDCRGAHSNTYAPQERGINPEALLVLDPLLEGGLKPMRAMVALEKELRKSVNGTALWQSLNPPAPSISAVTDSSIGVPTFPSLLSKVQTRLKTMKEAAYGSQTKYEVNQLLMNRTLSLESPAAEVKEKLHQLAAQHGENALICLGRLPLPVGSCLLDTHLPAAENGQEVEPASSLADLEGYIVTSPRWMQNIQTALRDTPTGLSLAADGTFDLVTCKWVFIVVTTHTVNHPTGSTGKGSQISHTAIPLVAALVTTESQHAYSAVFAALKQVAAKMYDTTLSVRSVSMDHTPAIKNAAVHAFGFNVRIVDCWAHFIRKAREKARTYKCVEYYESVIEPQLHLLHCAPSSEVQRLLAGVAAAEWTRAKHDDYSQWFLSVYQSPAWPGLWWCGSAGTPGAGSTNNTIESVNNEIKSIIPGPCHMGHFIKAALPDYMISSAQNRCPLAIVRDVEHRQHLCISGDLPRGMVERAVKVLKCPGACIRLKCKDAVPRYAVSSSKYMAIPLTSERIIDSLTLDIADGASFQEAHLRFASFHTIRKVSSADVDAARKAYWVCDCKSYWFSGYLCSHVLAVYAVEKQLNLLNYVTGFNGPPKAGRTPNYTKALEGKPVAQSSSSAASASSSKKKKGKKRKLTVSYAGAEIRGINAWDGFLTGYVGTYSSANGTYLVNFPDAPVDEDAKKVHMTEEEVAAAYQAHTQAARSAKQAVMDTNGY